MAMIVWRSWSSDAPIACFRACDIRTRWPISPSSVCARASGVSNIAASIDGP